MQQAPQDLPIESQLEPLKRALSQHSLVLLEAPPGTGKTTRVPAAMLESLEGQIWVLEPRRLAARWAAQRVANLRGEALGERVGYRVRLDSRCGPNTRLVYMTQGVFTRHLQSHPELAGVSLVILDEFHERTLENDLALAWLRRARSVKTLVMSATLPGGLDQQLGAPLLSCSLPLHRVETHYRDGGKSLEQGVLEGVRELPGSGLIFLPGMREIRSVQRQLEPLAGRRGVRLQILHGSLPGPEQDEVLQANPKELRWVLCTNVAETSLTVPGISWVIDSGLARVSVHPPGQPLSRLETRKISQFSATQRTGRAGRQSAGTCLRLYSERDFQARPECEQPQILQQDLGDLTLSLLALGNPPLEWLVAPPAERWQAALQLLEQLGACQRQAITPLGRAMAELPLEPRLARLLLGWPGREGVRAAAWLSRGGDAQNPDLADYLARTSPPLPEERSLRPGERFAETSWEAALVAAFPDRVAQVRRGQDLILADGSGFRLRQSLPDNPWLVALQVEVDPDRQLRLQAFHRIDPVELMDRPEFQEYLQVEWNAQLERVEEVSQWRYGQLTLEESRRQAAPGLEAAALLARRARASAWWRELEQQAESWQGRYHWARTVDPTLTPPPDLEGWLLDVSQGCSSLEELQRHSPWHQVPAAIARLCPQEISLGRRRVRVHYRTDQSPWIEAKLVEFFGLSQGPRLAEGRIPLVLHLLAPNFRPVQVTQDLMGFWSRHYPKVRQELCRRYPRHPWPEDPLKPLAEELRPKRRQS